MKSPVKFYMTKRRKTQFLYWKILLGGVMLSSALIGGSTIHTDKYILKHGFIEPVRAESEPVVVETVEEQIIRLATEANFEWTAYLLRLARCENPELIPDLDNTYGNTPAQSRDRGIFAINSYWHYEVSDECAYNVTCATNWTMEMINAGRQSEWVCNSRI